MKNDFILNFRFFDLKLNIFPYLFFFFLVYVFLKTLKIL
jgi:hypothetical protein